VGIEIESDLVQRAQQLIDDLPAEFRFTGAPSNNDMSSPKRIHIVEGDVQAVLRELVTRLDGHQENRSGFMRQYEHLPTPDVMTIYLLPEGIAQIEGDLTKLLSTTRIVCASWGLKGLRPIDQKEFYDLRTGAQTTMYLYTNECFERLKGFDYMLSVYNHGH
jgi:hypothetical protein